jgi:hypothetical protein
MLFRQVSDDIYDDDGYGDDIYDDDGYGDDCDVYDDGDFNV